MPDTTPSAGPAPVEFTRERFDQLLQEAVRIARDPSMLLLPTRDHVRAQHAALMRAFEDRGAATQMVIALILSSEEVGVTIPVDALERARPLRLEINRQTAGYVILRVHAPAGGNGRVM